MREKLAPFPPLVVSAYRLAAGAIDRLPWGGKFGASLAGRRASVAHWLGWSRDHPPAAQRVWLHAASVGEALAAEPVLRRLQHTIRDLEVILSYSSPSVASWPGGFGARASGYAPPERRASVAEVFDALAPDLLVFSRSDLWPEMVLAAYERGVPVTVIGAVIRPRSLRLRWPARLLLKGLHRHLAFVGAVSELDSRGWLALGAPESAVVITGDPRHDQVLERPTSMARIRGLAGWAARGPTLVAGSVEEGDEAVVLDGLTAAHKRNPAARLLLVPHDPTPVALRRIIGRAPQAALAPEISEEGRATDAACLIVPDRGLLADLYALGMATYVGGGFRPGGLHAVVEPAGYGLPILAGPEFRSSADAVRLAAAGGLVGLPRRGAAEALTSQWQEWMQDDSRRWAAGLAARGSLFQGAAGVTARHLLPLLGDPGVTDLRPEGER
ncbi:MAG: hypothetical protein HY700_04100 [Gemmatimonadetes bacterium]|nr:hypothetical protein [Gemmatimonadota bacterium]